MNSQEVFISYFILSFYFDFDFVLLIRALWTDAHHILCLFTGYQICKQKSAAVGTPYLAGLQSYAQPQVHSLFVHIF